MLLYLVLVAAFLSVNVCYAMLFDLPTTALTLAYIFVLEFAAVGFSFHVAELFMCVVCQPVLLKQLPTLLERPTVALLCVTCDDADAISLRALKDQTYCGLSTFVLDDSQSDIQQEIVDASGIPVIRRSDRRGYKAGNLNHWLRHYGTGFKYFVVADADSRLPETLVEDLVRYAEHDSNERVAILETQIHAWNNSSRFAALLDTMSFLRDRYRLRVANRLDSTLSVGHNNLYRTAAVLAVGGFAEGFLAEDFATCIAITSTNGWRCKTVPLTSYERQPENVSEYTRRQSRWAYQTFQLLELQVPGVSWPVTLDLVRALHYYLAPLIMIGGLVLAVALNMHAYVVTTAASRVTSLDLSGLQGWPFWVLWMCAPAAVTAAMGRQHGRRLRDMACSMMLHSALFAVTSWPVARHVVGYVVGRSLEFIVTGRSPAPTLFGTFSVAGPISMLLWGVAATTLFNTASLVNLVWLIPACLGPFIIHAVQRSRPL